MAALVYLVAVVAMALFAPWLTTHDAEAQNLARVLDGPSSDHWLGTDQLGRDVYSRLVLGSRTALLASTQATAIAVLIGVPIGLLVGFLGGWWDRLANRVLEALIALPGLVLTLVIIAILGRGLTTAMLALGFAFSLAMMRLARGIALNIREAPFIEAAHVGAMTTRSIVTHHVLPNARGPLIVQVTLMFSAALLAEAGLSFLGLGAQPPTASWGAMLSDARGFVDRAPFLAIPPGSAIAATVLAINLFGDGLRDAFGGRRGLSPRASAKIRREAAAAAASAAPSVAPAASTTSAPDHTSASAFVEVTGLTVSVDAPGGRTVDLVRDVSFSIERGETVALVGESGAGKSILAHSFAHLLPPGVHVSSGTICLDGEVVDDAPATLRRVRGRRIGMVFQDPVGSLDPAMRVRTQLREVLRANGGSDVHSTSRSRELLALVGFPDPDRVLRAYPHQLSGGMAQRVALALALASEPELLIADEPTTALDATTQLRILELINRLRHELSLTVLLVTHDLGVVAALCDRSIVMYAGEIVEDAPTRTLVEQPEHPYSHALVGRDAAATGARQTLVSLGGSMPSPGRWPDGCRFRSRCDRATDACADHPTLVAAEPAEHLVRCIHPMSSAAPAQLVSDTVDARPGHTDAIADQKIGADRA